MTGATGAAGASSTGKAGVTGKAGTVSTGATGPTGSNDKRLNVFKVPQKFEKEPWAQEIKGIEDLWEKMSGAQKLIGKDKVPVPGENATPEELNIFYKKIGRPETPDGYDFKSITELQEVQRNDALDKGMKKIFFENGVSKKAGEQIVQEYEALLYDLHKPEIEKSAKQNVEFQKLASDVLGEDKVSAVEAFKTVMRESLGEKAFLVNKIDKMGNEELITLIAFSKNIHDRYTGENRVGVKPGQSSGLSGDLKADFQSLSSQKVAIKLDKNMPEHVRRVKLANINVQMTKIGTKAAEQGLDLFK